MRRIFSILLFSLITLSNILYSEQKLELNSLEFENTNWGYNPTDGVYYKIGLVYCENPVNTEYESLALYVPKEYLTCTESEGKYNCKINSSGKKGSYTAKNAPMVMPVNTPGYSAMKAPTSYDYRTVSEFLQKGIIYIYAGCRGKYDEQTNFTSGAPWGVTDLKAAVRYIRYNKDLIPGDSNKIYTFGMSGGGAQSCLMGATGNSPLYQNYLTEIGAKMEDKNGKEIKDNVKGSQCWCPITNLDTADAAYEWNMGQYYFEGTRANDTFTKSLSDDLAEEYAKYVNDIKLKDPKGNVLTLTNTNEGSYYDYLKLVIEESLNNFFEDTTFPYTPDGGRPFNQPPGPNPEPSKTYNTTEEYINDKNSDYEWLYYDNFTKKATIKSVGDFVKHCKLAKKDVAAFDDLNRNQAENQVFGTDINEKVKHFDKTVYKLLSNNNETYANKSGWNENYITDYLNDLDDVDLLGVNITTRLNMYNPMYYLIDYYEGYKTSDVADYFRINTGLFQPDTGNVVEMNLYLALKSLGKNVEFTTVWEKQHVEAERKGDANTNFISWIEQIEGANEDNKETDTSFSILMKINYLIYSLSLLLLV